MKKKSLLQSKTPTAKVKVIGRKGKESSGKAEEAKVKRAVESEPTVSSKKSKLAPKEDVVAAPKKAGKEPRKAPGSKRVKDAEEPASDAVALDLHSKPNDRVIGIAVDALLKHVQNYKQVKKPKLSLPGVDGEEQTVFLQIGLRKMPEEATKTFKGRPILLPHPFRDASTCTVCLLVKDKQECKTWLGDDYKKHGIEKIISLQQLRQRYNSFQSRRELADTYDVFIADDRIVCMLPKALGKSFYVGPKRPLPIRLARHEKVTGDGVSSKISKAINSAYFYLSGVSTSVRIGNTEMAADDLRENVKAVLAGCSEHVAGKWKGIQNVYIKSEKSVALPIYESPIQASRADEE